jgi:hypothetical protein
MLGKVIHKIHRVMHSQDSQFNANWENALSAMTEVEMLTEMKSQLLKVSQDKPKNILYKMQIVLDIDEKLYRNIQQLTHNYLKSLNKNNELKNEVEVAIYEYLRQLYSTYMHILTEYQQQANIVLSADKINLLLARYLNTAFMMAKWRYFDDQPAPVGLWSNVHQVIKIAEKLTMLNKELMLYPFHHKETSLAVILKRGFMLSTLQKGSYTPCQIELTDHVLKTWSTNPRISNQYTKQNEYQFFIHLDGDKSPQRLRSAKQHPDFRYWKTSRLVDLMETYLCAVDTGKSLEQFNLATKAKTEDLVGLFKKLRVDWCVKGYKRQRRNEERVAKFNILQVSHGLDQVSARIRYLHGKSNMAKPAFERIDLTLMADNQPSNWQTDGQHSNAYGRENWTMLEESQHGFSVELGKEMGDWLRSGVLIGYSTMDNNKIALAEIKAVRKRTNGTYRVGLAKLTSSAVLLAVSTVQKNASFGAVADYVVNDGEEGWAYSEMFSALFFDDDKFSKPRLIMPRYQYKRAGRYRIELNGEHHMILAGEVISSHRDWVCFDVID